MRFTFKMRKKQNKSQDNLARQFMAFIQVVLVQPICGMAKKENKNPKDVSVLALLHGIAVLFLKLESKEREGVLSYDELLWLKEQVILTNMNFAFDKKDITVQRIEEFTQMIYEVLSQTKCEDSTNVRAGVEQVVSFFCKITQMNEEDKVNNLFLQLERCIDKELKAKLKTQVLEER